MRSDGNVEIHHVGQIDTKYIYIRVHTFEFQIMHFARCVHGVHNYLVYSHTIISDIFLGIPAG